MTVVLTILGAVLIGAGLVLLFGGKRDSHGETRFKWKDVEIASAKPSIVLICLGVVVVVVPHVTHHDEPSGPSIPGFQIPVSPVYTPQTSQLCCLASGTITLPMPDVVGSLCWRNDAFGQPIELGTVCK